MDFFKGRLQATEGSYHKTQQEEDLKEYRLKRLKEGGLKPDPTRLPFNESDLDRNAATGGASGDKLAEIYAQEARLASQDVERRRVSSQMPPMEGTGRRNVGGLGALGLAVPKTSLGRPRWVTVADDRPLIIEETAAMIKNRELAQRAMAAGTRALLFGTTFAVCGVVIGVQLATSYYDIKSVEDLRGAVQATLGPSADSLKGYSRQTKLWVDGKLGRAPSDSSDANGASRGFSAIDPITEAARGFGEELKRTKAIRSLLAGGASNGGGGGLK